MKDKNFKKGETVYMVGTIGKCPLSGWESFIPKNGGYIVTDKSNLLKLDEIKDLVEKRVNKMGTTGIDNKESKYGFSINGLNFEPLSSEVSYDIFNPEIISIPKSEYDLLIEIKNKFLSID